MLLPQMVVGNDVRGSIPRTKESHTFTHPGTYVYYCDIHGFDFRNGTAGGMAATIKLNADPEPAAALLVFQTLLVLRLRR